MATATTAPATMTISSWLLLIQPDSDPAAPDSAEVPGPPPRSCGSQ